MKSNSFVFRKTQKYFITEIILFMIHTFVLLARSSKASSSVILAIVFLLSLKIDKARLYTPLIILSILLFTLRAVFQIQSWIYYILEVLIFILSILLSFTIRVFDIPNRYGLY